LKKKFSIPKSATLKKVATPSLRTGLVGLTSFVLKQIRERERSDNVKAIGSKFAMVRISEEELNRDEKRLSGTGPTNDQRLSGIGMVCDRKLTGRVNFGLNFEENYI
jgi:hypothetical protein